MWSPKELTAALKEVAYHEIRHWLRVLKLVAYSIIWIISFILIGTPIEAALGENHRGGILVAVLASTAITVLVRYLKPIVLTKAD